MSNYNKTISTIIDNELLTKTFGSKFDSNIFQSLMDIENLINREVYLPIGIDVTEETPKYDKDGEYISTVIRRFNIQDEERNIPIEDRIPIKIYIDCYGGSLSSAMSIIDTIKLSKTPVYTIDSSVAYSAAGLILMAGHKRFAYPSASVLIHKGSMRLMGNANEIEDTFDFNKQYENDIVKPFVVNSTKITSEKYDERSRYEWFMTVKDMLEYGIIDKVVDNFMDIK